MDRIEYAGSVHGDDEIEAVVGVLRGGPTALRLGLFMPIDSSQAVPGQTYPRK